MQSSLKRKPIMVLLALLVVFSLFVGGLFSYTRHNTPGAPSPFTTLFTHTGNIQFAVISHIPKTQAHYVSSPEFEKLLANKADPSLQRIQVDVYAQAPDPLKFPQGIGPYYQFAYNIHSGQISLAVNFLSQPIDQKEVSAVAEKFSLGLALQQRDQHLSNYDSTADPNHVVVFKYLNQIFADQSIQNYPIVNLTYE